MQVVLTNHAHSLDLFDELARPARPTQAALTISLPATSAGKFKQQLSREDAGRDAGELRFRLNGTALSPLIHSSAACLAFGLSSARLAPQKENQCQES
jgi:hypothetical protein